MAELAFEPVDDRRNVLGEGPFWDSESGCLYLVDIVGQDVLRICDDGCRVWHMPHPVSAAIPRRSGGLIVTLPDGTYLFDPQSGELECFARTEPDIVGNRANEARTDRRGRLWLGTMQNNIAPDGAPLPVERTLGTLAVIEKPGAYRRLLSGIGIANTLCWSPANDQLYFADSLASVIFVFDFDLETGDLAGQRAFSDLAGYGAPDGSAIDEDGFLWNARWGAGCIIRFAPDGEVDRVIPVPVTQPTSCVFGGPDRATLYVTSATHGLGEAALRANPLEGATLRAETACRGERCVRFAG